MGCMKMATETTSEAIERVAKLRGPAKAHKAALILLGRGLANHDTAQRQRSVRITKSMLTAFRRAFPEVDHQVIGDIVADLDSLWDTGQQLDGELRKFFRMRFPQDREELREFLAFIEAVQIEMVGFWIGNLRNRIPKLLHALDRQKKKRSTGHKT
jgi:hypothetical protein